MGFKALIANEPALDRDYWVRRLDVLVVAVAELLGGAPSARVGVVAGEQLPEAPLRLLLVNRPIPSAPEHESSQRLHVLPHVLVLVHGTATAEINVRRGSRHLHSKT